MKLKTRFQLLPPKLLRAVTGCLLGLFFLAIVLALLQARSHASTPVAAAPSPLIGLLDGDPSTPSYEAKYDLDGDKDIDLVYIMLVVAHLGETCSTVTATPTNTPTSTPTLTPTATPTPTNTPTATPTSVRPTPNPNIDKTVNGQQGPITVTQGDSVTYYWVVTNAGDRPFFATVDDDMHDALDGECPFVREPCERVAVVTLLTPGLVTNTSRVVACGIPPWPDHCQAGYDEDSVTVNVVTPTPTSTPTATFQVYLPLLWKSR